MLTYKHYFPKNFYWFIMSRPVYVYNSDSNLIMWSLLYMGLHYCAAKRDVLFSKLFWMFAVWSTHLCTLLVRVLVETVHIPTNVNNKCPRMIARFWFMLWFLTHVLQSGTISLAIILIQNPFLPQLMIRHKKRDSFSCRSIRLMSSLLCVISLCSIQLESILKINLRFYLFVSWSRIHW